MERLPGGPPFAIGHVNLRVADLERSIRFYRDAFGFAVKRHRPGSTLAFLGVGDAAFHLGLDPGHYTEGAPPPGAAGLDHLALQYPSRRALAAACRRLVEHGVAILYAQEHNIAQSVYCADPDGNGLELYWERPPEQWEMEGDWWRSRIDPLDLDALLAEAPTDAPAPRRRTPRA
jgi:catechol 2,3-dioxygenase